MATQLKTNAMVDSDCTKEQYWKLIKSVCASCFGEAHYPHSRPYTYVEIGVASARTFNTVAPLFDIAHAVDIGDVTGSIDPTLLGRTTVHVCTSDDYVASISGIGVEHSAPALDCVFIDGLHTYDQVMADFRGVFPYVREGGLVFLHDTYPADARHLDPCLCGDVFRATETLRRDYGHLAEVLSTPADFGVTIVRKMGIDAPYVHWMKRGPGE